MKTSAFFSFLFLIGFFSTFHQSLGQNLDYLNPIKEELQKEWPGNRTVNLVFHGHSVPAGYFKTPVVNTLQSYPFLVLKELKEKYPFAVINSINTSIGGENSISGEKRFSKEVLSHHPDVIFIDYSLNDRGPGLADSKKAWEKMIRKGLKKGIKIILLTPSPDLKENLEDENGVLAKHREQVIALSKKYNLGLVDSYSRFLEIQKNCNCLEDYMSQGNHPNEKGHQMITEEIMKYF